MESVRKLASCLIDDAACWGSVMLGMATSSAHITSSMSIRGDEDFRG